jgi:hypothetical protein
MIFIFVLAFVFGTVIFKVIMRNSGTINTGNTNSSNISEVKDSVKTTDSTTGSNKIFKFIAIQGGIYKNKENVEAERSILNQYGTPFNIIEDSKTRVFLGIYAESQGEQIMKSLAEQKIDNSKMLFAISTNDLCDAEIVEIINANIQILNKLGEKNVKAVQTDELKKWCTSLNKVNSDSKNISVLNDIKDHVSKMPKEITKDKAAENYEYIYGVLKKMNSK